MSKKRGVLVSAPAIAKSHSHPHHPHLPHLPHPHNHPATESNLLSEEPEPLVNQAYYTYHDPDSLPRQQHLSSEKSEDDHEEQAIQSMQKRQQEILRQRREEEERARLERAKNTANKLNRARPPTANRSKPHPVPADKPTPRPRQKEHAASQQKLKGDPERKERREINPAVLKPRPLVFSVNMFSKGSLSPRSSQAEEHVLSKLSERIEQRALVGVREGPWEEAAGENLNCKKLPFRFSAVM